MKDKNIILENKTKMDSLKSSLLEKITEINVSNKTPVIFFLIGTYPGYSNIHQTPPYICDVIKDDNMSPIVILFDSFYKNKNNTESNPLAFLTNKTELSECNEGTWYYPHYIKNLKNSYMGKVAYQYYAENMTEELMNELLNMVSPNLSFVWSFTSITFGKDFIKKENCHILEGNCMANLKFQSDYFPVIKMKNNNQYYIESNSITLTEIVDEIIKLQPFKIATNQELEYFSKLEQLYGFVYYYVSRWLEEFKSYKTWEIQIRLYDPTNKLKLTKWSSSEDWNHFKYRVGPYFDVDKMIKQFKLSDFDSLEDFINHSIFENGMQLVKLDSIDLSESSRETQFSSFYEEYEQLLNSNKLPNLFSNYLYRFNTKYNK